MAAAEAYARVGIAETDAFIECWNAKYVYNLQRPVTYIQENIDASWLPYLVTPNFPTYTSGHSTQSGAAATVLTDMFGIVAFTDTIRTDHNLVPPLAPRTFDSFATAAAEAAASRLYTSLSTITTGSLPASASARRSSRACALRTTTMTTTTVRISYK